MTEDKAPPAPLPPAAEPPYPAHPAPQEHSDTPAVSAEEVAPAAGAGLGPLGMTLIGGAVAAVGLAIALPFLRRRRKAVAESKPKTRRKARPKG